MQPYEILADPYTIYLAPVGTPFPAIDDDEQDFIAGGSPGGEWFRLGSSGNRNYEEGGVTITPEQETSEFRGAGETAPQKAFRTSEGLVIGLTLVDLSTDQHAKALDDRDVTTVAAGAGTAGHKSFDGYRGIHVKTYALLGRGMSPEDPELYRQLEVPVCYQSGGGEHTNQKGTPAGIALEYRALRPDPNQPFYTVRNGTAPATS